MATNRENKQTFEEAMEELERIVEKLEEGDEESKKLWEAVRSHYNTTITAKIPPSEVFNTMLNCKYGFFHTNGILLKKTVFEGSGLFDTDLKLSQDTFQWLKISALYDLYPGSLDNPVAVRRIFGGNRIIKDSDNVKYFNNLLYLKLFQWSIKKEIHDDHKRLIFYKFYISISNTIKAKSFLFERLVFNQIVRNINILRDSFYLRFIIKNLVKRLTTGRILIVPQSTL